MAESTGEFIARVVSALGTWYLWGGTDPFHGGSDCSGLMYWGAEYAIPRTSSAQWAALPHVISPVQGDLVFFNVPSDGGPQPAHVGMYVSPNLMIEAPYTGQKVRYSNIPNGPGQWVMGYGRIPFSPQPVPSQPPPAPPPPPNMKVGKMNAPDYQTNGTWVVDTDGHVEAWGGAPYLGALNEPVPDRAHWKETGVIWGITPVLDTDGWGYAIIVRHFTPFSVPGGPQGQWFSPFTFHRDGRDI